MGFIFGTYFRNLTSQLKSWSTKTNGRWLQHHEIRCRSQRPHEDLRTIHAGFGGYFWVRWLWALHLARPGTSPQPRLVLIAILLDSFFMSIGTVIRTEGNSPLTTEAYARARRQPMVLSRKYARRPGEGGPE